MIRDLNFRTDMEFESVLQAVESYESTGGKWTMDSFKDWCKEHVFPDIKDWKDFKYDELTEKDDSRYPNQYWLACLRRGKFFAEGDFDTLIDYLKEVWYDFGDDNAVEKIDENTYQFYTAGWSGNEDVIGALLNSFATLIFEIKWVTNSVCQIRRSHYVD